MAARNAADVYWGESRETEQWLGATPERAKKKRVGPSTTLVDRFVERIFGFLFDDSLNRRSIIRKCLLIRGAMVGRRSALERPIVTAVFTWNRHQILSFIT
jgi:hypothetical protein